MRTDPVSLHSKCQRIVARACRAAVVALAMVPVAAAAASWRDHAQPFVFLFENDFDTHQQSFLRQNGELAGFFYIKFTGAVTADGLRVARHVNCGAEPGCVAGWKLSGRSAMATYLYHVMPDHPVWLVPRHMIPQPGAYTHFHWEGEHPTAPGEMRTGYLLELQALDTFCFVHGGGGGGGGGHGGETAQAGHGGPPPSGDCTDIGGLRVVPGLDTATHTNIVSSYQSSDHGGH